MKGIEIIKSKQQKWATKKNLKLVGGTISNKGEEIYLENLADNLFQPLAVDILNQFENGDGNETSDSNGKLAKMKALHSSSALVVNAFQYWNKKDVYPILYACNLCSKYPSGIDMMKENIGSHKPKIYSITRNPKAKIIDFEVKFKISDNTKSFPIQPNIDIVIGNFLPEVFAIESKFAEPYRDKPKGIRKAYIDNKAFWTELPELYRLAQEICPENNRFQYLDAAQLIKHILGLKARYPDNGFRLLYLWYDVMGNDGAEHRKEIEEFEKITKSDAIKFSHITYQEVIKTLSDEFYKDNESYCDYMTQRYI